MSESRIAERYGKTAPNLAASWRNRGAGVSVCMRAAGLTIFQES